VAVSGPVTPANADARTQGLSVSSHWRDGLECLLPDVR